MARLSDLPEELVVEILIWLPVDSLIRSKCVLKSWYSLITSPKFIAKQLRTPIHDKNSCLLLKSRLVNGRGKEAKVLSSLSFVSENEVTIVKRKIVEFPLNTKIHQLSGHCHGIVCLLAPSGNVILANSAIREFRKLPEPCKYFCRQLVLGGFGYDPKSKDYKVIRVVSFVVGYAPYSIVEVYNLSTDSWRVLNNSGLSEVYCFSKIQRFDCRYVNGFCNWLAFDGFNSFILSFDTSTEVFQIIKFPDFDSFFLRVMKIGISLIEYNDSLAFVMPILEADDEIYLEMWILDEINACGSWRRHLKLGAFLKLQKPLVFWGNDEIIIEDVEDGAMCCYNLGTQEMKVVPVKRYLAPFAAVSYKSSLVSIKAGSKLEVEFLSE